MDVRKMKAAAEWFRNTVFQDEAIRPRPVQKPDRAVNGKKERLAQKQTEFEYIDLDKEEK